MNRYSLIKNLVEKKYYSTVEEIVEVIDYMVIMQKISFEQGQELNILANDLYAVIEEETDVTDNIENIENAEQEVTE